MGYTSTAPGMGGGYGPAAGAVGGYGPTGAADYGRTADYGRADFGARTDYGNHSDEWCLFSFENMWESVLYNHSMSISHTEQLHKNDIRREKYKFSAFRIVIILYIININVYKKFLQ